MKFAEPSWLFGLAVAALVAVFLIVGGVVVLRAIRRFGDPERVDALVTYRAGTRRAVKGVLLVLAVCAGFVALAQPQYGRGTRLIPATNLDVVIALDYSKSMHAKDVTPSRTDRAKAEVSKLIAALPGARFGAVAFAGEPISFPLTSDGGAIAQFFRQMTPEDMPIGGTAIARALEASRQLLARDPLSRRHKKVILLVTDGEDLEGDPVSVAEGLATEGISIDVVQIGGRTPEPIPEVNAAGEVVGWRKGSDGQPLTTSLSAAGEEQLTEVARKTGGSVIRSARGDTGIETVTRSLRKMMTEELSERVETVYADVYAYPAALAALLLLIEAFIGEVRRKRLPKKKASVAAAATAATTSMILLVGCEGSIKDPFVRYSPAVDDAIHALDGGDPSAAANLLESYLQSGECKEGEIGTPESIRKLPNASYDLGLALFRIGERFGARFGEPAKDDEPKAKADLAVKRSHEVDCALRIVRLVAAAEGEDASLRARAQYLTGNLEFLREEYAAAVEAYDAALKLVPASDEKTADSLGKDAAWNRAIALRRKEEQEEKEKDHPDAGPQDQPPPDGGSRDGGNQDENQNKDQGDAGPNEPNRGDAGPQKPPERDGGSGNEPDEPEEKDGGNSGKKNQPEPEEPQEQPQAKENAAPPPPSLSQDQRMLDQLEQAPTVQQEAARRSSGRRVLGMEDK